MKRILFFVCLVFSTSILSAESILIIKENTSYKKALVEELKKRLLDDGMTVEVVDFKKEDISALDPRDYDAVYILNSGAQARVRPVISNWLDSVSAYNSNILIHTTQRNQWTPQVKVDSITSASKKSNIDEMIIEILHIIEAKL